MAMRVTVGDVCAPFLTTFPARTTRKEARYCWEDKYQDCGLGDPLEHVSLVTEQGSPIGTIDFEDLLTDELTQVSSCMHPLSWAAVISADLPLIEAATLFRKDSPYLFTVLRGNRLTDYLSYQDLLSLPFRACLFSTILGIEELLSELIQTNVNLAVGKYERLPRTRIRKILNNLGGTGSKSKPIPNSSIVRQLYFSEKLKLIQACNASASQLPSFHTTYVRQRRLLRPTGSTFKEETKLRIQQAKDIRNELAHPNEAWRLSLLLPKEELGDFLTWLNKFERELMDYLALGHKLSD